MSLWETGQAESRTRLNPIIFTNRNDHAFLDYAFDAIYRELWQQAQSMFLRSRSTTCIPPCLLRSTVGWSRDLRGSGYVSGNWPGFMLGAGAAVLRSLRWTAGSNCP